MAENMQAICVPRFNSASLNIAGCTEKDTTGMV